MCAKAFVNEGKYYRALEELKFDKDRKLTGKEKLELIERYQKMGGRVVEGTNLEISQMPKMDAIYDEKKEEKKESVKTKKAKK